MEGSQWIALAGLVTGILSAGAASAQSLDAGCPGGPVPRLRRDFLAVVEPGTPPVNLRSAPSYRGDRVGTLTADDLFAVTNGPACADGATWWEVSSGALHGWAAEGRGEQYYLAPYEPEPIATAADGHVAVNEDGVAFGFDGKLAPAVSLEYLPEIQANPDGWTIYAAPEGTQFTFFDGTEGTAYPRSTLVVYAADGFARLHPDQGAKIDALKALITAESASAGELIPEVPGRNAAQMIRSSIAYVKLADGGKGVRYLTYYAQQSYPVTNHTLYYQYRGFSADGSRYVRLQFALRASILPDSIDNGEFWSDEDFGRYSDNITRLLDDLPTNQFTPHLDLLDALVGSIHFSDDE